MRKLKVAIINSPFDECDRKILFEIILSEFVYSEFFDVSHINEILESEYKTNVWWKKIISVNISRQNNKSHNIKTYRLYP